jgi:hypothetical protein
MAERPRIHVEKANHRLMLSLLVSLGDPLECPHLLACRVETHKIRISEQNPETQRPQTVLTHPRVHNLVTTLDTLGTTLDSLVDTLGDDDGDLLLLGLASGLAQELHHLRRLVPLVHVGRISQAVHLPLGLFHTHRSLHLLPRLGLGDLFDWSCIESSLFCSERLDGLFGDGQVGLVVFALIVQEPGGKTVLVVKVVLVESVVNHLVGGEFSVDKCGGHSDGFGGQKTLL